MNNKYKVINNRRINDFLYLNNIFPIWEFDSGSVYLRSKQLGELLDDYYIRYTLFRNRL